MVFFSSNRKGYGFGPMPGFSKKKKSTLGRGNWDRDPKPNRTDCQPFNFKKQDDIYGELAPKCPKCKAQTTIQDDSFDYGPGHHGSGGTQYIKYAQCPKCGWEED